MKVAKNIVFVLLMIALIIVPTLANAVALTPNSIKGDTTNANSIASLGNSIVGVLQVIGIIASVAVLVILGIKYMLGSTEEKAEYKKTLLPYLIGAVLIFSASVFSQKIYEWATSVFK